MLALSDEGIKFYNDNFRMEFVRDQAEFGEFDLGLFLGATKLVGPLNC